jgi:hypothetical protein
MCVKKIISLALEFALRLELFNGPTLLGRYRLLFVVRAKALAVYVVHRALAAEAGDGRLPIHNHRPSASIMAYRVISSGLACEQLPEVLDIQSGVFASAELTKILLA